MVGVLGFVFDVEGRDGGMFLVDVFFRGFVFRFFRRVYFESGCVCGSRWRVRVFFL